MIAVRLGESTTSFTSGNPGQKIAAGKGKNLSKKGSGKPGQRKRRPGNPQRKSQYATHPVYTKYKTAQKAVETYAKENKIPFKEVTGEIRVTYDEALEAWLQTKSGFRGSKKEPGGPGAEPEENQVTRTVAVGNAETDEQVALAALLAATSMAAQLPESGETETSMVAELPEAGEKDHVDDNSTEISSTKRRKISWSNSQTGSAVKESGSGKKKSPKSDKEKGDKKPKSKSSRKSKS